jgi:hypothetical protein
MVVYPPSTGVSGASAILGVHATSLGNNSPTAGMAVAAELGQRRLVTLTGGGEQHLGLPAGTVDVDSI